MTKLGRNDPCRCGSGRKYKYCHLDVDRDRLVNINPSLHPVGTPVQLNFKDDLASVPAAFAGPLMRFCSDNDFYLFGSIITVRDLEAAHNSLEQGTLSKQQLLDACKRTARLEPITETVKDACKSFDSFTGREKILLDAVGAHFDGKYTLSVPVLFAQLEGILRSIGALQYKDTFKPTIKKDIWDNRLLFGVGDSVKYFNAFISKLYEGQKNETFNRNPVLHGTNLTYDTEEYSLLLILSILEIRTFLWFEKNTQAVV